MKRAEVFQEVLPPTLSTIPSTLVLGDTSAAVVLEAFGDRLLARLYFII